MRGLLVPLAFVFASCAACAVYEEVIRKEVPSLGSLKTLDASYAYNMVSFALSLLLIFKTNSSYGRYRRSYSSVQCLVCFSH
jgi:predicted membrane chloride channel (bestrophin family)